MHDFCFRVIDSWNSWVISTIASSWVLISQSIHRSRWCFFPGSRIPLHRFCRADTADPTAEWPSRQSSRGALRFPWFPLRKGSGWNGCQGGMEPDSLRIWKKAACSSEVISTIHPFPFRLFSLYSHLIQLWQDIIRIPLKKERSSTLRSGLPLACRGHRLREVPEFQVDWEVKQVDEPIISHREKNMKKYKCCKFRSLFFSTIGIAAIKLNPNHIYNVFGPFKATHLVCTCPTLKRHMVALSKLSQEGGHRVVQRHWHSRALLDEQTERTVCRRSSREPYHICHMCYGWWLKELHLLSYGIFL